MAAKCLTTDRLEPPRQVEKPAFEKTCAGYSDGLRVTFARRVFQHDDNGQCGAGSIATCDAAVPISAGYISGLGKHNSNEADSHIARHVGARGCFSG